MDIPDFLDNDVELVSGEIFEVTELEGAASPLLYIRHSLDTKISKESSSEDHISG